jgi:hypothetical protein
LARGQRVPGDCDTFRRRGADRLQYRLALPNDADRFEYVERLLPRLAEETPARRAATG